MFGRGQPLFLPPQHPAPLTTSATVPAASIATPDGRKNDAAVPTPLAEPLTPLMPARVETRPDEMTMRRMMKLPVSAYREGHEGELEEGKERRGGTGRQCRSEHLNTRREWPARSTTQAQAPSHPPLESLSNGHIMIAQLR